MPIQSRLEPDAPTRLDEPACRESKTAFAPVFIVGCPRSGTTLLTVTLDRHPRIAVPGETDFLRTALPRLWMRKRMHQGGDLHRALARVPFTGRNAERFSALQLDEDALLQRFERYPADARHLLRAVLEEYAVRAGKDVPGEKSPAHLFDVPRILRWYPDAKIICMMRDGRDVSLSLMNVSWADNNLRRHALYWRYCASLTAKFERRYPKQFLRVHFEDLVRDSDRTLEGIAAFLNVHIDTESLLDVSSRASKSESKDASPVPEWETGWKGKARDKPDPSRAGAWANKATPFERHVLNSMMAPELRRFGYKNLGLSDCSRAELLRHRALNALYAVIYHPALWAAALSVKCALEERESSE